MGLTLVLGGTRSGKSAHAERFAHASGLPVRYVATADASDPAMAGRIDAHVARRPADWTTVAAAEQLALACANRTGLCVLIDGLGTWIAGALHRAGAFDGGAGSIATALAAVAAEIEALVHATADVPEPTIVVVEQAGEGALPADAASRAWLDALGEASQRLSAVAARAVLVVAGRPIELPAAPLGEPADGVALRSHGDTLVGPADADHAVNVLEGGPPAWLSEELHRALDGDAAAYPHESAAAEALAALHGRTPAEVVPCNGAAQALWLLPAALRPRLAACVHPGFTEGEVALRAHGAAVARVLREPDRGFALDPEAVPAAADTVIVGNPASPSGTIDPRAAVLALRRPGRTVIVDEAFMDLVPGEPSSLVRESLPDVIVIRSLTKSLGIPGLRAGYAVAPMALAERLRAVRPPWSCNALALAALRATAERPDALAEAAARAQFERADLEARLGDIPGLRVWPAAANFVLVRVAGGAAVAKRLRAAGIAVRPAGSFPGLTRDDLRITARDPAANARLASALDDALASDPGPAS